MRSFSQRDVQWASYMLNPSKLSIGRYGCTTTCMADLSTYFGDNLNPLQISEIIKYTPDGLVVWQSAVFKDFQFESRQIGRNDIDIKKALNDPNRAVILNVSSGSHWVVATGYDIFGNLKIADPWFGDESTMKRYQDDITGAAYFKRKAVAS